MNSPARRIPPDPLEEALGRDFRRPREPHHRLDPRLPSTSLDQRDLGPMNLRPFRQAFLGQLSRLPDAQDVLAEPVGDLDHHAIEAVRAAKQILALLPELEPAG